MDIEYIAMCMKAKEIQDHKFIYGDCWSDDGERCLIVMPNSFPVANCIWLPRQEQLQEMVDGTVHERLIGFIEFALHHPEGSDFKSCWLMYDLTSMEQLWLAFVMKEKFNKVWNGEDWIFKTGKRG